MRTAARLPSLAIDFIDKAFFFQLAHDAVIDQVVDRDLAAGRLLQGVVELDLHSVA